MADQAIDKMDAGAPVADAPAEDVKASEPAAEATAADDAKPDVPTADAVKTEGDVEMTDAAPADEPSILDTPAKTPNSRRKSGAGDSKTKTLNKKGSKARLTNLNAQPGDYFLVKLKGYPAWPAVVCDEDMLPSALITSRPATARRATGEFSENYADGGKRVYDRNFPMMYLATNEFGWVINTALTELTAEKAENMVTDKMSKLLKAAFEIAAKQEPLSAHKDRLDEAMQAIEAEKAELEQMQQEQGEELEHKSAKKKAKRAPDSDDADAEEAPKSAKSKKRKADEDASTPQRSDSVKKPKIKLNTSTPKTANGAAKGKDESTTKKLNKKASAAKLKGAATKSDPSKEVTLTPEERLARKEKEVLYLRHKLQRGLLTRDQQPQESEMEQMSGFITMLENFDDLEVSIIRATKINKVLKAILKLDSVPKEEEFGFKKRSQTLLDKWNKLLAVDAPPAAANGVNGSADAAEKKSETNGVDDVAEKETAPEAAELAEKSADTPTKKEEAVEETPAVAAEA